MNKAKIFLIVGIMMVVLAVAFVVYALSNPQASFNIPSSVLYILYLIYIIVAVLMFVLG